ncbi:MAG: polysaccharide biosynthesis C-terminal domain-containing protein, partial [Acidimicrobiales bacterium]
LTVRETARGMALQQPRSIRGVWAWTGKVTLIFSFALATVGVIVVTAVSDSQLDEQALAILWALLLMPVMTLGNLVGAALRGLHKIVAGQIPEFIFRPLLLLALLSGLYLWFGSLSASESMAVHVLAAVLALGGGVIILWRHVPPEVREASSLVNRAAWFSSALPLALVAGLTTVNALADIILLGLYESPDQVGIYRVAVQVATLASFGLQAINLVVAPRFASLHAQEEAARLQRLVTVTARIVLAFALLVTIAFAIIGRPLLDFVFGSVFVAAFTPALILLGGHLVNSAVGSVGQLLNMTGHERDTAWGVGVAAVVNVGLNLVLVPRWGIEGAATATAASFVIWNVWLWRAVRRRLGINSLAFNVGGGRTR